MVPGYSRPSAMDSRAGTTTFSGRVGDSRRRSGHRLRRTARSRAEPPAKLPDRLEKSYGGCRRAVGGSPLARSGSTPRTPAGTSDTPSIGQRCGCRSPRRAGDPLGSQPPYAVFGPPSSLLAAAMAWRPIQGSVTGIQRPIFSLGGRSRIAFSSWTVITPIATERSTPPAVLRIPKNVVLTYFTGRFSPQLSR